ncbi:hypothetical protein FUT69_06565 [Xylella taiwanensis]|uniref:Uncharacterized protein n=1 Tax=Xylella taiwanensis TaxID=1444770 RepID=A0ABS8TUH1_9GAMM|nr:hypothetical protein [Xylella taiwanensis]AXI83386.1 hypothetical protein AB672_05245 [Xylella taiwanensis]MCD8456453.1 hypothetical protein [Xylella taiwanensis]MCD8458860.1 hypothetical protein [Xylella taiwanensis]MCD8460997.1 hypothetical protein [Xylella taiwanensis]MCD8462942.1 hypothetical protein [Xylella taiwanensis]
MTARDCYRHIEFDNGVIFRKYSGDVANRTETPVNRALDGRNRCSSDHDLLVSQPVMRHAPRLQLDTKDERRVEVVDDGVIRCDVTGVL